MKISSISNSTLVHRFNSPKFGVNEEFKKHYIAWEKANKRASEWSEYSLAALVMGYILTLPSVVSNKNQYTKSKIFGIGLLGTALVSQFYSWFLQNKYYKEERTKLNLTK